MVNDGVPNDTIESLNPISGIFLAPIVQKGLYPILTRRRIRFGPIARIAVGFAILAVAIVYKVGLQKMVYNAGPCYDRPLVCPASNVGKMPNQISMFLQTPIYVLNGLAESLLSYYRYRIRLQPSSAEHEVGHPIHLARNEWYWVLACLGIYASVQQPALGYYVLVLDWGYGSDDSRLLGHFQGQR